MGKNDRGEGGEKRVARANLGAISKRSTTQWQLSMKPWGDLRLVCAATQAQKRRKIGSKPALNRLHNRPKSAFSPTQQGNLIGTIA